MGRAASADRDREAFGYKVDIDHDCVESEHPDEAYSAWSEDWSNSFRTIRRSSPQDAYPDAVAVEDFAPGDLVYVVWAEWTQADSYGAARGRGCDVLGVFRTWDEAHGLEELARAAQDYEPVEYLGLAYRFGAFTGYFDTLDAVHIEQTHIYR